MNDMRIAITPKAHKSSQWLPLLTLIFLAPFIGEVLSGSTRISFIFAFVPEMMVWGCGSLLIREAVRRWHGGWTSMMLLGLGLAIAEEFVIQQTSLAPLPWPAISALYGRTWGVNWIYFLFMLGYECVWIALVPVQITELIFRRHRNDPWLGNFGFIMTGVVFLLGSYIAWFAWVKRARPITFHVPEYHPAPVLIWSGVGGIILLIVVAYMLRKTGEYHSHPLRAVSIWVALICSIVLALPWYCLMMLIFGIQATWPFWISAIVGVIWALLAYSVTRYLSSALNWGDMHRWAISFGATCVIMGAGFVGSAAWPSIDMVGKIAFNAVAVIGLLVLAYSIKKAQRHRARCNANQYDL